MSTDENFAETCQICGASYLIEAGEPEMRPKMSGTDSTFAA
jgi:hypothetical protein